MIDEYIARCKRIKEIYGRAEVTKVINILLLNITDESELKYAKKLIKENNLK